MKSMTFNVRCEVGSDGVNNWPNRIDAATGMILKHDVSIVGLQEVTDRMHSDIIATLSDYEATGDGRNPDFLGERCTILYKSVELELLESRTFWLSETPDIPGSMDPEEGFPRICTAVVFRRKLDGMRFRVLNVHFAYRSERAKMQNVTTLIDYYQLVESSMHLPTILMGDFNCNSKDHIHRLLRGSGFRDGFQELGVTHEPTFHAFQGGLGLEALDFIYVDCELRFESIQIDRSLINGKFPSDHYPVIAQVSFL